MDLSIMSEVSSGAEITAELLEERIVDGFEQPGITVTWEPR